MLAAVVLMLIAGPAMAPATPPPAAMTPAQKAKLAPRRPTRQIVGAPLPVVPARPEPVGTLPVHPTPSNAAPLAPMPVPVGSSADGGQYSPGAAGVVVDPAGRTCHRMGATLQCF